MRIEVQIIRDGNENVSFYATENGHGMGPGDRINYRDLLRKYIEFVGEQKGTTFIYRASSPLFTDEEVAELKYLEE